MSYECLSWAISRSIKGCSQSVLNVLAFHVNKDGKCWPNYSTLAKETGFSTKTIQRSILELEKLGFIRIERNGYRNSNVYVFNKSYPQGVRSQSPHSEKSVDKSHQRQVTQSIETGHSDLLIEKNINIECSFNKNQEGQEMYSIRDRYKSEPHLLRNLLRDMMVKKENGS